MFCAREHYESYCAPNRMDNRMQKLHTEIVYKYYCLQCYFKKINEPFERNCHFVMKSWNNISFDLTKLLMKFQDLFQCNFTTIESYKN